MFSEAYFALCAHVHVISPADPEGHVYIRGIFQESESESQRRIAIAGRHFVITIADAALARKTAQFRIPVDGGYVPMALSAMCAFTSGI